MTPKDKFGTILVLCIGLFPESKLQNMLLDAAKKKDNQTVYMLCGVAIDEAVYRGLITFDRAQDSLDTIELFSSFTTYHMSIEFIHLCQRNKIRAEELFKRQIPMRLANIINN